MAKHTEQTDAHAAPGDGNDCAEAGQNAYKTAVVNALQVYGMHQRTVHPSPRQGCSACVMGVGLSRDIPKANEHPQEISRLIETTRKATPTCEHVGRQPRCKRDREGRCLMCCGHYHFR